MNQPFKLYRLQQIDSQLYKAYARLSEIEKTLDDNSKLIQAQTRLENASDKFELTRKALQEAEHNVKMQQVKIEQSESTLYSGKVRNPKELQDLQNEAAALKRYKGVLEDRQLDAMIKLEDAEEKLSSSQINLDQVLAEITKRNSNLIGEQQSLQQDVERLEDERKAAVTSIDKNTVNLYSNLRKTRKGVAVAKVSDKNCTACGSTLSAALKQAARSANEINFCDTCGRILYSG